VKMHSNPYYIRVFNHKFSVHTNTGYACKNIMQYLFTAEDLSVNEKLYFDFLRTKVSNKVDNEDFINGVFMLARSDFNILVQKFEALNEDTGDFEPVMPDDVISMLSSSSYFNPLNGRKLTEDEAAVQIRTFFSPSKAFINSLAN